jgi:hypothetical protein
MPFAKEVKFSLWKAVEVYSVLRSRVTHTVTTLGLYVWVRSEATRQMDRLGFTPQKYYLILISVRG